jgi:hypothetical protein
MTQGEKQLLLKDLCARAPYGVIVHRYSDNCYSDNCDISIDNVDDFVCFLEYSEGEEFKPYLRPMSSMTEEEKEEFENLVFKYDFGDIQFPVENTIMYWDSFEEVLNYLISHHFDFRGLIEKGLAFEAPKDMYKL